MTTKLTQHWHCAARWMDPHHATDCDEHGDTDNGAKKHTEKTGHATLTGTDPEMLTRRLRDLAAGGQR